MRRLDRMSVEWLSRPMTPDFVDGEYLMHMLTSIMRIEESADDVSSQAFQRWRSSLERAGAIQRVRRGVYANITKTPKPSPEMAAEILRPGARVTLQSVLGSVGILNNPSRVVFASVRTSDSAAVRRRHHSAPFCEIEIVSLDDEVFDLLPDDSVDPNCRYVRATPERALCDWFYLAKWNRHPMSLPPNDCDLDDIDEARLGRLAEAMEVADAITEWRRTLVDSAEHSFMF